MQVAELPDRDQSVQFVNIDSGICSDLNPEPAAGNLSFERLMSDIT